MTYKISKLIVLASLVIMCNKSALGINADTPDQECAFDTTTVVFQSPLTFVDMSYNLPQYGLFTAGTLGWTANTNGGGSIISYNSTGTLSPGEVGIRCTTNQSAFIDIPAPVAVSTSSNGTPYDWDYLAVCVQYRANTTSTNAVDRLIAGKFSMVIYDAYSTQNVDDVYFDASSDATSGNVSTTLGTNSTWVTYVNQFSPIHYNCTSLSHIQFIYSVPTTSKSIPTTEILIQRIIFFSVKIARQPNG